MHTLARIEKWSDDDGSRCLTLFFRNGADPRGGGFDVYLTLNDALDLLAKLGGVVGREVSEQRPDSTLNERIAQAKRAESHL